MSQIADLSLADIEVGMQAELAWDVSEDDIDAFASLSGDINPLHVDATFARAQGFRNRVAHGLLLGSKVSAFIGTIMPGRRCLLLEQSLAFPNPVFPGDRIVVRGQVAELWSEQSLLRLKIRATKQDAGASVTVGRGMVLCRMLS
jgi:acyl dehydratase